MGDTSDTTGESHRANWTSGNTTKRFIPFNLDALEWHRVQMPKSPNKRPAELADVDFQQYFEHGMWNAFVDAGSFNVLGIKLAPNFTIPRHHHNIDQLVLVHEGEVWLGSRCYGPGDAYFTRANHTYSITAGDPGAIVFEIRKDPITTLTLDWDDLDPARWVHGRRPGGPAHAHVAGDDD